MVIIAKSLIDFLGFGIEELITCPKNGLRAHSFRMGSRLRHKDDVGDSSSRWIAESFPARPLTETDAKTTLNKLIPGGDR